MTRVRVAQTLMTNDLRILRSDPIFAVTFAIMPLLVMAFTKQAFGPALRAEGLQGATGAEHAVPASAVLFAFFLVGNIGFGVFRENGWATWQRVRVATPSRLALLVGKTAVPI